MSHVHLTQVTVSSQEVLGILLDWVSELNLKVAFDDRFYKQSGAKHDEKAEALVQTIQDKCCKVLYYFHFLWSHFFVCMILAHET